MFHERAAGTGHSKNDKSWRGYVRAVKQGWFGKKVDAGLFNVPTKMFGLAALSGGETEK